MSLFFVLILFSNFVKASYDCTANDKIVVRSVNIFGNTKTKNKVLLRELNFNLNEPICKANILDATERIKRTGLFSELSYQLNHVDSSNQIELNINVKEKWTTIPVLKFNSGGGVSQFTFGVYDPNIGGNYIEAGAQYENLAGAGSGVLWYKNPKFLDQNQGIDLQYWNTKRVRVKYDQDSRSPKIKNGFLQEREKFYTDYFKEYSANKVIRFSLDYNHDQFSTDFLSDTVLGKMGSDPILPPSTKYIISKLGFEFGQIRGESHALNGSLLGYYFGYAQPIDAQQGSFNQLDFTYSYFVTPKPNWQLAHRFLVGSTSTDVLQYWYYLGGLDRIRGFSDNRFSGRHFGLSNSELRYLVLHKPSYMLQSAVFVDFALIGEKWSDLNQIHAASVGAGVRLILPQFYRLVVRLDYGKPIIRNDDMNLSLGVQQFF